ncbi:hypothetical protein TNCV_2557821 [Trichonephila clavipes]|nr:hypothetical protein TNCV_2557821 [Trichonephila clavipes]
MPHATKYPPSTHTEYVLVKSVGRSPCGLSHELQELRTFPSLQFHAKNCGGGDRWYRRAQILLSPGMVLNSNDRRTSSPLPR